MKEKKEKKEGYIKNAYLRELIIKFNKMNINDDGLWCDAYERKLDNKKNKGNIIDEKYSLSKSFILRKKEEIRTLHDTYDNMTREEKLKFDLEFDKLKNEICDAFMKVINGRIISYKLISSPAYSEIDDIKQEALMTLFTYINRYDESRNTSAFAFVTQLISNALNLYLSQMNERNATEITGIDFFDNLNTIDDPHGSDD